MHELDVSLEKIKCELALKVDFNLRDLFRFLDLERKGFIDFRDFERICGYLNFNYFDKDLQRDYIKMFIKTFDRDYDDRLLFTDIGRIFLSLKPQYS